MLIATYDRPGMVQVAIDSVLHQSEESWELIVTDDAGPRPVTPVRDSRVRILRNAENLGKARSLNNALDLARGRFIAFLDDDDAWAPDRLAHARQAHEVADVVICDTMALGPPPPDANSDSEPVPLSWISPRVRNQQELLAPQGATTITRSLCPKFDPSLRAAEDLEWGICISDLPIMRVHSRDFLWRRHEGPRFRNGLHARIDCSIRLLSEQEEWYERHPRALAFRLYRLGVMTLQNGDRRAARRYAAKSFMKRPNLGAVKVLLRSLVGVLSRRIGERTRPFAGRRRQS